MRFCHLLILIFATLPLAAQVKGSITPEVIYAKSRESVVTILTFDSNRAPLAQGSGFIVAKNRVVTNYHVIAGSTSASIIFDDGSIAMITAVVSGSGPEDLVIVEAETGNRPALALGDELELKVGETIYAIGSPRGLSASLSNGLVSGFRQDAGQFLIQITAPISSGSSGGPLLNTQGQVVGVTTSQLKDGSFGFAMGAGDLKHLLKVPLRIKVQLSDLTPEQASTPDELKSVQGLYDQKKYEDAYASFNALSNSTKSSFDAQLLLCKIQEGRKDYQSAIQACDAAIQSKPEMGAPYGEKALSLMMLGNNEEAEGAASKAVKLSDETYYTNLLAVIHYSEEKYELVPKELPASSDNGFVLTLLAGAAYHNRDYDSFRQFRDRLTALKGENNAWALFTAGVAAEKELNWDVAIEKYKKCDADTDFVDPICIISAVRAELSDINYSTAKTDMDNAVLHYPKSHDVLAEAVFVNLLFGNTGEADRLHGQLKSTTQGVDESTDCLYYYGRNQPLLATSHCEAAVRENENNHSAWSNAGYAALDSRDFQSAFSRFTKAAQLLNASKEKHTGTQEIDLCWGLIIAEYYSGDRKDAKNLYRAVKKDYPQFLTTNALKQLPLVWSDYTVKLIDRVAADLK
jgi:tetratricopeptide (TPR) repeat protein